MISLCMLSSREGPGGLQCTGSQRVRHNWACASRKARATAWILGGTGRPGEWAGQGVQADQLWAGGRVCTHACLRSPEVVCAHGQGSSGKAGGEAREKAGPREGDRAPHSSPGSSLQHEILPR